MQYEDMGLSDVEIDNIINSEMGNNDSSQFIFWKIGENEYSVYVYCQNISSTCKISRDLLENLAGEGDITELRTTVSMVHLPKITNIILKYDEVMDKYKRDLNETQRAEELSNIINICFPVIQKNQHIRTHNNEVFVVDRLYDENGEIDVGHTLGLGAFDLNFEVSSYQPGKVVMDEDERSVLKTKEAYDEWTKKNRSIMEEEDRKDQERLRLEAERNEELRRQEEEEEAKREKERMDRERKIRVDMFLKKYENKP
jgi:hypothetical protein